MSSLIEKYNISERDLYAISLINSKKKSAGLIEKEKLKASALSYLKPYNVKFFDIGGILNEISKKDYHLINSVTEEEKRAIEAGINQKSDIAAFYKDWWNRRSKKQKFLILLFTVSIVFSLLMPQGNQIGDINQDLTNKFSGEYRGVETAGAVIVKWEINIDPIKYEGNKTYTSYVSGSAKDNFGGYVSLQKSKLLIKVDDSLNPIQICFKDQYGSSLLGGDPCSIKQESNGFIVSEKGFTITRISNRFHDWTKKHKN